LDLKIPLVSGSGAKDFRLKMRRMISRGSSGGLIDKKHCAPPADLALSGRFSPEGGRQP